MKAGDKVRLIANPGRIGILGSETDGPEQRRKVIVHFLDGDDQFVLIGALEPLMATEKGPYGLMIKGRYGRSADLRGLMTYFRLSGKLANLIYSLNTTNTQFLAYQFKPVLHFLSSPCNGILIADEVGLGKTIEAGLIWTELRARQEAKRLLVICPAMLRDKWQMELSNRFGVNAQIVDAGDLLKYLSKIKESPTESFALIASMQGLRPPKGWDDLDNKSNTSSARLAQFLDDAELDDPLLDLVIIDEAHYLRNRETQTFKLGNLLRPVAQNLILLSATPIQLRSTDLFNLLHLIDEDAFPFESSFDETLRANAPIVRLRDEILKTIITQKNFIYTLQTAINNERLFEDNKQIEYLINFPPTDEFLASPSGRSEIAEKLDRINPLAKVVTRTLKRDVQEFRVQRMPHAIRVRMNSKESEFYEKVTNQVREYCSKIDISTGFMLTIPQRQMSSSMAAACRAWVDKIGDNLDDSDEETLAENFGDFDETNRTPQLGTLLVELVTIAKKIGNYKELRASDSKFNSLIRNLKLYWNENPNKKVVLFSFYRKTLIYLQERLNEEKISSIIVFGGIDKSVALQKFESTNGPNILLSSEVASEGVDLQFSSLVINYDLPWNPMRIEQRIGRIDRIGQEAERILIWNFIYEDSIDEKIYDRLLERLNIFKQALGSFEAILGDQIRQLGYELLSHNLSNEQENSRIEQAQIAIENLNRQQTNLESEATHLIAHGDFIQNKVRASKELGRYIRGEDLLAYVSDCLPKYFPGTRIVHSDNDEFLVDLELSIDAKIKIEDFVNTNRIQGSTKLLSSNPPKLLFENKLGKTAVNIERVTQEHPLIRFVSSYLKTYLNDLPYHRVSAIELPAYKLDKFERGNYVYAVSRWSITGSRAIERLEFIAVNLSTEDYYYGDAAEQIVNTAAMFGNDWLSYRNDLNLENAANFYDKCSTKLEERFKLFSEDSSREDRDRISLMLNLLNHHLNEQKQKILDRIDFYQEWGTEKQKKLIPAEKGRLKKLTERLLTRMAELKQKEHAEISESFVSAGVIHLV